MINSPKKKFMKALTWKIIGLGFVGKEVIKWK